MNILVGPDGRVWDPHSYDFMHHVGYWGTDVNILRYATRNLGFVGLRIVPRYTYLWVQPSLFPAACFDRILEILILNEPPCVVIERASGSFAPLEVIANLNDAVARLRALQVATPAKNAFSPNIFTLAIPRLRHPKRTVLCTAFQAWKAAHGYVDTANIQSLANNPAFGQGTIAWLPGRDRCLIEAWPSTYNRYGDRSGERYQGRDVREHPDIDYVLPTTRAYFTAAHEQAPRLELIEALITHQDGSELWTRYERLILPWRTKGNDTFVSSVPLIRLIRRG